MNNETKRDVFDEVLEEWQIDETMPDANWKYPDFKLVRSKEKRFKDRYDAALPDDLPVIPEAVGCMITKMKPICKSILDSQYRDYGKDHRWIIDHYDTFARAWLLGVWRVEETGEIVKLEEEK